MSARSTFIDCHSMIGVIVGTDFCHIRKNGNAEHITMFSIPEHLTKCSFYIRLIPNQFLFM